jgi:hypothetical protein
MQQLKKTFIHGLALAIPLAVVGYVFFKIIKIFERIIHPIASKLGIERVLGALTLSVFAIFLLLLLIIMMGLFMKLAFFASLKIELEGIALKLFPWLNQLKVLAANTPDMENVGAYWKPVMVNIEKNYYPAFLIEESQTLVSFFIVKGAKPLEGEMLTTEKSLVTYYPIDGHDIRTVSRQYGKGMIALVEKLERQP